MTSVDHPLSDTGEPAPADMLEHSSTREDAEGEPTVETWDGDDSSHALDEQDSAQSPLFSRQLSVLSDPAGVQSSAVGALRNHLSQQHIRAGRRSLAICSVSDDSNRSVITANLAVAIAQSGMSTVLVDANMREPELGGMFHSAEPHPGLSDYLAGNVSDPTELLHALVLPNLSVIHAGVPPVDPQALLASEKFESLMGDLMRSFDFTIVDCPPANLSADARRISSVLRYALIVVKRDVTFVADVRQLIDELTSDRVNVIGTFLNVQ